MKRVESKRSEIRRTRLFVCWPPRRWDILALVRPLEWPLARPRRARLGSLRAREMARLLGRSVARTLGSPDANSSVRLAESLAAAHEKWITRSTQHAARTAHRAPLGVGR